MDTFRWDETDVNDAARRLADNWKKPRVRERYGARELLRAEEIASRGGRWAILTMPDLSGGYDDNYIVAESNRNVWSETMEKYADGEDPDIVPFTDKYMVRVYSEPGKYDDEEEDITSAFEEWHGHQQALAEDGILNDDDAIERSAAYEMRNIRDAGDDYVRRRAPKDWPKLVMGWLWDNERESMESMTEGSVYIPADPGIELVKVALRALGLYRHATDD